LPVNEAACHSYVQSFEILGDYHNDSYVVVPIWSNQTGTAHGSRSRSKAQFRNSSNRLADTQHDESRLKKPIADNAIFNDRLTSI
jgi:hypothetical protein